MNKKFNLQEMPQAYFCNNTRADGLRNEMIKNQIRINECEQGALETTFFSDENMNLINKQLIMKVYEKSDKKYKIGPQSKQSLLIVMRYIFIEHARHLPYDIKEQIRELNCRVVTDILPNIITNVEQKLEYIKLIESPRQILSLPISTNNKNRKTLPSVDKRNSIF
jgi:hypothetical protein